MVVAFVSTAAIWLGSMRGGSNGAAVPDQPNVSRSWGENGYRKAIPFRFGLSSNHIPRLEGAGLY